MKKLILTLAAFTAFGSVAHAQLHRRNVSYVGLKAGGTSASFMGTDAQYLRSVYGFHAGVFANLPLYQPFSIQPEMLFSMKGQRGQASVSDATTRLNYLDIPVAFRAAMNGLFAEIGPQAGFLLTAKSNESGENVNVRNKYRSFDFGYLVGVGYQPKEGGLGVSGRFNASFLSAYANPIDGTEPRDARNSAFQLSLTYSARKDHRSKKSHKPR